MNWTTRMGWSNDWETNNCECICGVQRVYRRCDSPSLRWHQSNNRIGIVTWDRIFLSERVRELESCSQVGRRTLDALRRLPTASRIQHEGRSCRPMEQKARFCDGWYEWSPAEASHPLRGFAATRMTMSDLTNSARLSGRPPRLGGLKGASGRDTPRG
jgi:hypothetical protein